MDTKQLTEEVEEIATLISSRRKISFALAMEFAISIQRNKIEMDRNKIIAGAFMVREGFPSALEAIAMQLGYTNKKSMTLVDLIMSFKDE